MGDGDAPIELIELRLCRDVYHCPPQMLPPLPTIMKHMQVMKGEARYKELNQGLS